MSIVAIITGYSSGLGYSISEELLKRGWTIVGVARQRKPENLQKAYPGKVYHIAGSVFDDDTANNAFAEATKHGGARLVVNCAGEGCFGDVGSYSASDVMKAIEGNLAGLIVFSDRAISHMQDGGGNIVNIMSTAAKKHRISESVYTAVKWGAKAYTRTIRDAVKSKKLDIRVFEVYPCGMKTPFWSSATRPVSDGLAFPETEPIARAIVEAVLANESSYQQELTFERS